MTQGIVADTASAVANWGDDTDVDTLDYHEMKAAIPQLGFIDVVGFDGCNMVTLEIYKLWRGKATALAASEE